MYMIKDNSKKPKSSESTSRWDEANLLSKYFLFYIWKGEWLRRLACRISSKEKDALEWDESERPPNGDEADRLTDKLEINFRNEVSSNEVRSSNLIRAIIKTFGPSLMKLGLLDVISKCLVQPIQIVSMGLLIRHSMNYGQLMSSPSSCEDDENICDNSQDRYKLYWLILIDSFVLILTTWIFSLMNHPHFLQAHRIGLRCRIATSGLIYRKTLKLKQFAMLEANTGLLTNMLSNDVARFDNACSTGIHLVSSPIQAIIVMVLLWTKYLGGWATFACFASTLLQTSVQGSIARALGMFRSKTASRTDERIRIVNELIVAIRVIKMYAWEEPFKRLVVESRRREMYMIRITAILRTINQTLTFMANKVILFVSLMTFVLLGNKLEPEVTFVSMGLANLLRYSLTAFLPNAISFAAEVIVSCRRINNFLCLDENQENKNVANINYNHTESERGRSIEIKFDHVSFSRLKGSETIIQDATFTLEAQDLVIIVGRVGSGKTSLLYAALGECYLEKGSIEMYGRCSYAPQEAWIFPGTIKENIIFGQSDEFDEIRYNSVIDVCCLRSDLKLLPYGDDTLVGDRGVSLSGGQKARVNLARALYRKADIYLLDDPLSAVDGPVANNIFENALKKFLSSNIVILATHQSKFLSQASKVIILDDDNRIVFGNLSQVSQTDAFKKLNIPLAIAGEHSKIENVDTKQEVKGDSLEIKNKCPQSIDKLRTTGTDEIDVVQASLPSYWYYIRSGAGYPILVWYFAITIVNQTLSQMSEVVIGVWTRNVQDRQDNLVESTNSDGSLDDKRFAHIYVWIIILSFISAFIRSATLCMMTLRASTNIHKKFFASVIDAPIKFFDFNPIGILLNRLGRDIGIIDENLPITIADIMLVLVGFISRFTTATVIQPTSGLPSFGLMILALVLRSYMTRTFIRLKKMEGAQGAPILTHVSVSLNGLTTIRAFGAEKQLLQTYYRKLDAYFSISYTCMCTARAVGFAAEVLSIALVSVVVLTTVFTSIDTTSASLIGLLISQVMMIPGPIQWGIRQLIEMESFMTSVERVKKLSDIEPEERDQDRVNMENLSVIEKPIGNIKGDIVFENVSLKYFSDEQPVLKCINIKILAGEKIGIVGRTGAGKSSIISVLLRLYPFEGSIKISGFDTKLMSTRKLRSSISIIPQDPVLFTGSIRKNLDPFGDYSDDLLWVALESVQLGTFFETTDEKLEFNIEESGANLSVGQRQLVCLARAIIRKNNILIMDEATANVDGETDQLIQNTIKNEFKDHTVITIAHRLDTIIDSDRVLVLDKGQVCEFDNPKILIKDPFSMLKKMIESGPQSHCDKLKAMIAKLD